MLDWTTHSNCDRKMLLGMESPSELRSSMPTTGFSETEGERTKSNSTHPQKF